MNALLLRLAHWLPLLLLAGLAAAPAVAAKVLIVVSGEGRDGGKSRPGFEMDEFAQAWLILRDNGLEIDVASPRGGAVQADGYNAAEAFNARLLADAQAQRWLRATRAIGALSAADYAAIYIVGGKGAMFDLAADATLHRLVAQIYERGGVVAAVCHGPAALAAVRLGDGRALVAGKALTGFSNEEEALFGKRWSAQYRFLIEDALREQGARWSEAAPMLPHVVVDGRLITGQNPYSTPALAEAIVRALGRTPLARVPWRDERSMALVQQLLAGDSDGAQRELARQPAHHHVQLIGLLGYYQSKSAADDSARRRALAIMELALPQMHEPQLKLAIAETRWQLGDAAGARALLAAVLASRPDMAEARQLQARMDR